MLVADPPSAPVAPAPPAPAPPSAPVADGRVRLTAGLNCIPPGGRLAVRLRVRRRAGRALPARRRA